MLLSNSCGSTSELKAHTFLKNYRDIKHVLDEVDKTLLTPNVDGILMDLGMSSMQVLVSKTSVLILFLSTLLHDGDVIAY